MENQPSPGRRGRTLGRSVSIGCSAFVALLCLVLGVVDFLSFERALYARYDAHIRDVLRFTRSQIDVDDLAECVRTGVKSEKYVALQRFMDSFKDSADIHYLYVIRPLNRNPSDNVMDIIAAMSSREKESMPEMEVRLGGLTGEGYSVESVSKYLDAAEGEGISYFVADWVKGATYVDYTGALPLRTSGGEYVGLLCVDVDVSEIRGVVVEASLRNLLLVVLLGSAFTALFIAWSRRNITRPIQRLENCVTEFAYRHKGAENVESIVIEDPGIRTGNEVESLSEAVVKMSRDIRAYVERVVEAEGRARAMSELANRDALTGVLNRNAYDNFSRGVNEQISRGEAEFAVAMVDLNHLKLINDTYGHEHGNEYIKMSSRVICNIFTRSPVFRVGGDEFVVVLRGDDFLSRATLLRKANAVFRRTESRADVEPWERLSCAIGMSDFERGADSSIDDVFNRADRAMYENKAAMKAARGT